MWGTLWKQAVRSGRRYSVTGEGSVKDYRECGDGTCLPRKSQGTTERSLAFHLRLKSNTRLPGIPSLQDVPCRALGSVGASANPKARLSLCHRLGERQPARAMPLTEAHPVVVAQAVHLLAEVLQHPGGHAVDVERRGRARPEGEGRLLQRHRPRSRSAQPRSRQRRTERRPAPLTGLSSVPQSLLFPGLPSQPAPARQPSSLRGRGRGTARDARPAASAASCSGWRQVQSGFSFPWLVIAPARLPNYQFHVPEARDAFPAVAHSWRAGGADRAGRARSGARRSPGSPAERL